MGECKPFLKINRVLDRLGLVRHFFETFDEFNNFYLFPTKDIEKLWNSGLMLPKKAVSTILPKE